MDTQAFQYSSGQVYDYCNFGYYDSRNGNSFEQIIDHIRSENVETVTNDYPSYNTDQFVLNAALLVDHNHLCYPPQDHLLDLSSNTLTTMNCTTNTASDLKSVFSSLPPVNTTTTTHEDYLEAAGEEAGENNDGDDQYSSGTTTITSAAATTTTSRKKSKADRSKTLSAERKRRGRMKENLYSLRSLVPNITKMDKASIVGDAILYVEDLQMQAKQLKAEIAGLEASSSSSMKRTGSSQSFVEITNPMKTQVAALQNINTIEKNIMKMDVFQVEERGYYVRLESNIGKGIAAALYRTLEFLTFFAIQNSNLSTAPGRFVLTATINVRDSCGEEISLPNMKLWISKALLKQGFEFKSASASASPSPSSIASLNYVLVAGGDWSGF